MLAKKKISYILAAIILLGGLVWLEAQTAVEPEVGDGTEDNPYLIVSLENLYWITASDEVVPNPGREHRWSSHYIQTANIDAFETSQWFGGRGWSPIGNSLTNSFTGTYNGQGHTIDNIYINRPTDDYIGLFGHISYGASLINLGVNNVNITGRNSNGGIGGYINRNSTVKNCYSTGSVRGERHVGGLVGHSRVSSIINCYSTGSVTGEPYVGGLVGSIDNNSTVSNSYYNYEQVLINDENVITVGAMENELFIRWLDNDLTLDIDDYLVSAEGRYLINSVDDFKKILAFGQFEEYSYSLTVNLDLEDYPNFYIPYLSGDFDGNGFTIANLTLNIEFLSNIGLFGYTIGASLKNLGVINVDINGTDSVGGLVGSMWSFTRVRNCYNTGRVIGDIYVGGLVGSSRDSIFNDSYSAVSVTGNNRIGGLVGAPTGSAVSNSYSAGDVTGVSFVGGLVGMNSIGSSIVYSYSTGNVTGVTLVGGLVGSNFESNIRNSYSMGNVTGERNVGGLAGRNCGNRFNSTISNCYSTGRITGESDVGGLVGYVDRNSIINDSYYNTETSGQRDTGKGEPRITDEMTYPYYAYAGWDFEHFWREDRFYDLNNGYPILYWYVSDAPRIASNSSPEDSADGVSVELEYISWNYREDPSYTNPGGFRVYFNDTGVFREDDDFEWVSYVEDLVEYTCADIIPEELQYAIRYFWKVVPTTKEEGIGEGYDARNVPVWSFTTELYANPIVAANPYPSDDSVGVSVDLDELQWDYIGDEVYTNPSGFRVYFNDTGEFGEDDEFFWVPYIEEQVEYDCAEILPEQLDYETTYYWKVVPSTKEDGIGEGKDAQDVPVWSFTTQEATSVDDNAPVLITELRGNYPNPFNPDTRIRYELPEAAEVRLEIYNPLGQRVAILVSAYQGPGSYTAHFDASNLASGVYLYRLHAGDTVKTRKMLLLR